MRSVQWRKIGQFIGDTVDTVARNSPARMAVVVFAFIITTITILLTLPIATASGASAPLVDALFTATSAVCVTGLTTVTTATFWSGFGQTVIAIGIKIGGLGVMTLASILGLAVSRKIGLTQRMLAARETKSRLGEVGTLVRTVLVVSITAEIILACVLYPSFAKLADSASQAIGHSVFMAISIFNNAGFVILDGGTNQFVDNWAVSLPIIVGTATGAIGFPVILDVTRNPLRPREWTLHSKLTISTYILLGLGTFVALILFEWNNTHTFGMMPTGDRILAAAVHSVTPRSSGLSTVDIGAMSESSWFLLDATMFVGGGSASTGGGIKVTTFAVLVLAIVAEARGDRDIEIFSRRISESTVRLAVASAFFGATVVGLATLLLLQITTLRLDVVLFEVISAFATCGLSTGITAYLPTSAKYVVTALMFAGRVGIMTMAAALAMRSRRRVIRMAEEAPLIG